jgi:glycolate oxidase iron-sulfur subunit
MALSPIPGLHPVYEDYARRVHCELCLSACPTYRLWSLLADSPCGRIHQMIHLEQANVAVTDSFVEHIDKCLDCRACETACFSGMEYGKLVEFARARIERDYQRPLSSRLARDFVYRRLLAHTHRIAAAARLLRFYQRFGLQSIARFTGILKLLGLAERERLLPRVDQHFFYDRFGSIFPAVGERRARVAVFAGGIANVRLRN